MVSITVEPRFNEPLYNEVQDITNDTFQPGQSYSKMYGKEPRYNEPRYDGILVITNTIEKSRRIIYPDITRLCQQLTKARSTRIKILQFCNRTTSQLTAHYKC